jgi:peroxiredoxin Q/BCP
MSFKLHLDQIAPSFQLTAAQGQEWSLNSFLGKMVVLYFARGEYCPTTRGEMALWESYSRNFPKMNCETAFVVNGGREEHAKFASDLRMKLPILIDDDGAIGDIYGVYGVNHKDLNRDDYKNYIAPAVYLINADGTIGAFWLAASPRGLPTPDAIFGILAYAQANNWKY